MRLFIILMVCVLVACDSGPTKEQKQAIRELDSLVEAGRRDRIDYAQMSKHTEWRGRMRRLLMETGYSKRKAEAYIDSVTVDNYRGRLPRWYSDYKRTHDSVLEASWYKEK
jgi:hypothetical protein